MTAWQGINREFSPAGATRWVQTEREFLVAVRRNFVSAECSEVLLQIHKALQLEQLLPRPER
jgi:hypothetical protein